MNILENKRVTAISAVCLLAFAGISYYGFSRSQDFAKAKAGIAELTTQMEDFENTSLSYTSADGKSANIKCLPTAANAKMIATTAKQVEEANAALQKQLKEYEAFCIGNGKNITSVEFQTRVRAAIDEIAGKARAKGCGIANPASDLGMAAFKNAAVQAGDVPYRNFQLEAVKRVVSLIIDSGAASLEKVYCAPLPVEQINSKKPLPYFPLSFQVAFTAKRSTTTDGKTPENISPLPRVLNAITADKSFFLIPTGLSVVSEGSLSGVDAYREPSNVPQGEDLGAEEGEAAPAADQGRVIAIRKAGDPNELIRVHLNVQVLYFPGKGK